MPQLIERLGWVLVHSLWQFVVIAILAAVGTHMLRRSSATLRYAFLVTSMGLIVAAPIVTGVVLPASVDIRTENPELFAPANEAEPLSAATDTAGLSTFSEMPRGDAPGERSGVSPPVPIPNTSASGSSGDNEYRRADTQPLANEVADLLRPFLGWIVSFWGIGVLICSLRPLLGWRTLRRLRRIGISAPSDEILAAFARISKQLGLKRAVQVFNSTLAKGPLVVGYLRPVVLLPMSLVTSIPMPQLEAILAHELAHIRRHDFVINLLQTMVETLFFYHPAVWWLSHRIRIEREHCCDDLVIKLFNNAPDYGRALIAVQQLQGQTTSLALGAKDGSLLGRIRRIVGVGGNQEDCDRPSAEWMSIAVFCAMCVISTAWSLLGKDTSTESRPFLVTLPDGTSVELLGVSTGSTVNESSAENQKAGTVWWLPNGDPLNENPLKDLRNDPPFDRNDPHFKDWASVAVKIRGMKAEDNNISWIVIDGARQSTAAARGHEEQGWREEIRSAGPLPGLESGIVRVAIGAREFGPWQIVRPTQTQTVEIDGPIPVELESSYHESADIRFREVNGQTRLIGEPLNVSTHRAVGEFELIDVDGAVVGSSKSGVENGEYGETYPISLSRVSHYRFRLRPYRHWVTFENVSLQPGTRTEVAITTDSLPPSKPNNVAKLPGDIEVELSGVGLHPSMDHDWWRPDGSELRSQPDVSDDGKFTVGSDAQARAKCREFLIQIRGLPKDHSVSTNYEASSASGSTFQNGLWTGYHGAGPFDDATTTVKLSVATVPYGPVLEFDREGVKRKNLLIPKDLMSLYDHIVPLGVAEDAGETVLQIENAPYGDLYKLATWELVAVDTKGVQHRRNSEFVPAFPGPREHRFRLPKAEVSHFEYRVRPFQHFVTFENVSLEPGQKSEVKVSVKSLPSDTVQAFIPNGPMIQLLGVATPPIGPTSQDKREWWTGAGKLLDSPPVQPGSLHVGPDSGNGREFAVRLSGCNSNPITQLSLVNFSKNGQPIDKPKNSHSMGATHGSQAPEFGCTIESVQWPIGDADAATIEVKFGETPAIVVKYDSSGKRIADAQVDAALQNSPCQQLLDGVDIRRTGSHEDGFAVWTNLFSSSTDLGSVDLTLIDKSGNERRPLGSSGDGKENVRSYKVAPADVKAIAISLRPFTHVATFENVTLKAGRQTDVNVSIKAVDSKGDVASDTPLDKAAELKLFARRLRAITPASWTVEQKDRAFRLLGPKVAEGETQASILLWFDDFKIASNDLNKRDKSLPKILVLDNTRIGQAYFIRNEESYEGWGDFFLDVRKIEPVDHVAMAGADVTRNIPWFDAALVRDVEVGTDGRRYPILSQIEPIDFGITSLTKFLVIGELPDPKKATTDEERKIAQRYLATVNELRMNADTHGVPIISVAEFEAYTRTPLLEGRIERVHWIKDPNRIHPPECLISGEGLIEVPVAKAAAAVDDEQKPIEEIPLKGQLLNLRNEPIANATVCTRIWRRALL